MSLLYIINTNNQNKEQEQICIGGLHGVIQLYSIQQQQQQQTNCKLIQTFPQEHPSNQRITSIIQINPNTLQMLMRGMSFLSNGKNNGMKTSALDVCVFIYNQIGSENFLQLLNYSLSQEEVNNMGQAMQTHRMQKQKVPSVE